MCDQYSKEVSIETSNTCVPFLEKLRRCYCVFRGHKWVLNAQGVLYKTNEELENTITSRIYCKCCGIGLENARPVNYSHKTFHPPFVSKSKSRVIETEKTNH